MASVIPLSKDPYVHIVKQNGKIILVQVINKVYDENGKNITDKGSEIIELDE